MNQYTNATHRFEQLNGFAYKSEITGILKGLGFSEEDFTKEINTLSGGQRTRVALGKLLLKILIFCFLTNQQTTWMLIP